MEIKCSNCHKTFNVPEEKLPQASRFTFKCPACQEKTVVELESGKKSLDRATGAQDMGTEPDYFPPGASTALIGVIDEDMEERIRSYLEGKGYYLTIAQDADVAAAKARLNRYNLVFVQDDDRFAPLMNEIHSWGGNVRRETNVILIGERAESFHQSLAFLLAVDFYLNMKDREKIEEYLLLCIKEHEVMNELWFKAAREGENG
jgi:DNA-directed RNA polymerase subunit RPC12/RpoP